MDGLTEAMKWLGEQPDTIFLGQGVGCGGTKMAPSFEGVPADKRLEFPVAESLQLGVSIGLSLENFVPISVFPRIDFLLCAIDQLVLHLDKLPLYSEYEPKVIVRTAVGSKQPLDAGPQHTGDYTYALSCMLKTIHVRLVKGDFGTWPLRAEDPLDVYMEAYKKSSSTVVVE